MYHFLGTNNNSVEYNRQSLFDNFKQSIEFKGIFLTLFKYPFHYLCCTNETIEKNINYRTLYTGYFCRYGKNQTN